MNKKSLYLSYIELSFAQFCIGANIILGKYLINHFPMFPLLLVRFLLGFLITATCLAISKWRKTQKEYQSLSKHDWTILFCQALCGGFLFNVFILYGLQYTTATITGIINSAVPAFVALFSFLILKEKLSLAKCVAILLCIVGITVLGFDKSEGADAGTSPWLGIFLVLLAVVPEAMYTIFAKLLKSHLSPMANTALMNLFNAALFLPFALATDLIAPISSDLFLWVLVLLYSFSTVLFFLFWQRGVTNVSANTAALFMGVMPISTTLLAWLFLNESLSIYDAIGLSCVIAAIYFGTKEKAAKLSFLPEVLFKKVSKCP